MGKGTTGGDFYIAVFGVFQNEGNAGLLLSLVSAGFQVFFCHAGKLCICFAWYNVQFGAFHFFLIIIFEVRASTLLVGTEDKTDVFL